MNRQAEIFFESYSLAETAAYNAFFEMAEGNIEKNSNNNDTIEVYLQNERRKWGSTPLQMLEGRTPAEFLDIVDSLEQLTEMFIYGAVTCDDALPEIFLNKFKGYGEDAINVLLGIIAQRQEDCSEEKMLVIIMAVKVLGKWKTSNAAEPLIQALGIGGEICELMLETVRDALINIGVPALESILAALDQWRHPPVVVEYLIMTLSAIGRENPSDRIYRSLRKGFSQMENKAIAASGLADYGDGRAIPALRGYLEKHAHQTDVQTFHEIVSAIRRLGGKTDDLVYQMS